MSGGSWEYFYSRLEDVAQRLRGCECPYRKALGAKLQLAADALHDIEWVDSCDYGKGDDIKRLKLALGEDHKSLAYQELRNDAIEMIKKLEEFTDKD